jgi:hypothetical protein
MLRSKAAWALSRPGTRWRTVGNIFSAYSTPVQVVTARHYSKSSLKYIACGLYTSGSTQNTVVAVSSDAKNWVYYTIVNFRAYNVAWGPNNILVQGYDSNNLQVIQEYDTDFIFGGIVTYSDPAFVPRTLQWCAGLSKFVSASTTQYAHAPSSPGAVFTAIPGLTPAAGIRDIRYLDEFNIHVDVRDGFFPYVHKFFGAGLTISPEILGIFFPPNRSIGEYITYNVSSQKIYVVVSLNNLSTYSSSIRVIEYTSTGTYVTAYTTNLATDEFLQAVEFHPETQLLYFIVAHSSDRYTRLYSSSVNFPFMTAPKLVLQLPYQPYIPSLCNTPQGLQLMLADGTLYSSP